MLQVSTEARRPPLRICAAKALGKDRHCLDCSIHFLIFGVLEANFDDEPASPISGAGHSSALTREIPFQQKPHVPSHFTMIGCWLVHHLHISLLLVMPSDSSEARLKLCDALGHHDV